MAKCNQLTPRTFKGLTPSGTLTHARRKTRNGTQGKAGGMQSLWTQRLPSMKACSSLCKQRGVLSVAVSRLWHSLASNTKYVKCIMTFRTQHSASDGRVTSTTKLRHPRSEQCYCRLRTRQCVAYLSLCLSFCLVGE